MKLFQIQYFCAACEQNSITKAAELLHVSQPSVSTAIRALEEEFDCRLLERGGRGFSLTEEGRYFYQQSSKLLENSKELSRGMKVLGRQHNAVTLGASPMAAGRVLPHIFRILPQEGPRAVRLQILECGGNILDMLDSGYLDFALIPLNELIETQYQVLEIGDFEVVLAVPAGHRLADQTAVTPEELAEEPLAYFDEDSIFSTRINQIFERSHIHPHIQCITSQVYTIRRLISCGVALSFLFRGIVEETSDLRPISVDPPVRIRIGLVWRKGPTPRAAMSVFLKHMERFTYPGGASPETAP